MDAKQALENIVEAWEGLKGRQRHTPAAVEWWLRRDMKPAIDAARVVLKNGAVKVVTPEPAPVTNSPPVDNGKFSEIQREPFYDDEPL